MNYMNKIKEMLGVEFDEVFTVDNNGEEYCLNENGLLDMRYRNDSWNDLLVDILTGRANIIKKPYTPKEGDRFYYVCADGSIDNCIFSSKNTLNMLCCAMKNCFRTRAEAVENLNAMQQKYKEIRSELHIDND